MPLPYLSYEGETITGFNTVIPAKAGIQPQY